MAILNKPTITPLKLFIIWCSFHAFALLMSFSQIKIFNDNGEPKSNSFWPFVNFQICKSYYEETIKIEQCFFKGIFVDYDWTEFVFYVGVAIVTYLLILVSNKK